MKLALLATSIIFSAMVALVILLPMFVDIEPEQSRTCTDFKSLDTAIKVYILDHGVLPASLESLIENPKKPLLERIPTDPRKNAYILFQTNDEQYVLASLGADGVLGGVKENADIFSSSEFCGR